MKPRSRTLCVLAAAGLISVVVAVPALASARPAVTGLSTHRGPYWGGTLITVRGQDFTKVKKVMFGANQGWAVHVLSSTTLTVRDPEHKYGRVHVRVVTAAGTSSGTPLNWFTFTRPTVNTPIQGGLTGRQEQRISAQVRHTHKAVHTARRSRRWTAAMGVTAMKRARSWLGLPYSWAGGNSAGPTRGVCAHNGGDLDCHIVGFDCSGLTLYAWAPYKRLVHYAATQHWQAGRFHPRIGELMPGDLVFFSGYLPHGIGHVAIYEGHGMVIQAEESGTQVMRSRLVDVIAASGTYRGATRPTSTGRQAPGPQLSSMTSQISIKGGYLTITGSRLGAATSVSVGGKLIYSFAKRTSRRLVVKAPAHAAGTVSVVVSNAWGYARRTLAYVAPPRIWTLEPASGPATGGNPVVVAGRYLGTVTKATVGTTAVRFTISNSTRLTLTMPAHLAGRVPVTLYSRWGTSNRTAYTYIDVPPPTTTPTPPSPATRVSPSSPSPSAPSTSPASTPPSSPSTSPQSTPPSSSSAPPSTAPATPTSSAPPSSSSSTSAPASDTPSG